MLEQKNCLFKITYMILGAWLFTFIACVPYQEEQLTTIKFNVKDATFQRLHNFQDQSQLDSLYSFVSHPDPSYRHGVAMALASIQDKSTMNVLTTLLQDNIDTVRAAAAFAIGQIGAPEGEDLLLSAFNAQDTVGFYAKTNRAILEAVGKCGQDKTLEYLSTIQTYQSKDTALLEGQAWGLYRFALRNKTTAEGTKQMVDWLNNTNIPRQVRLIAANYLYRAKKLKLEPYLPSLINLLDKEQDADILMPLSIAISKIPTPEGLAALQNLYTATKDYRVKCNILRALTNYDYAATKDLALAEAKHPNQHIADRAIELLLEKGTGQDATTYWRMAKDTLSWQSQLGLYKAANRHIPGYNTTIVGNINYELRRRSETAENPYERALALSALGEHIWNYRYISERIGLDPAAVAQTTGMQALKQISSHPEFNRVFGNSRFAALKRFTQYYKDAITSGNVGKVAIAAQAIRLPDREFNAYLDSLNFMDEGLKKLELPRDIEGYNELEKTIAYFKNTSVQQTKPKYNHPIDWTLINRLTPNSTVTIFTNKGNIELTLMPDVAPGTVANFLDLARIGFFKDKTFHRVVPNFVIQGGCPRGDGFGARDYTIRSELSNIHYDKAGYVGMASAGNHTEGTQFFITHSPAPHLDGNYTIFASVTEGMDIVHQITMGDVIKNVVINY